MSSLDIFYIHYIFGNYEYLDYVQILLDSKSIFAILYPILKNLLESY